MTTDQTRVSRLEAIQHDLVFGRLIDAVEGRPLHDVTVVQARGRSYEATTIETSKGKHWFCSEDEARTAGWRAARR